MLQVSGINQTVQLKRQCMFNGHVQMLIEKMFMLECYHLMGKICIKNMGVHV